MDPANPHNWSTTRKSRITMLLSGMTICYAMSSSILSTASNSMTRQYNVSYTVATLGVSLFAVVCSQVFFRKSIFSSTKILNSQLLGSFCWITVLGTTFGALWTSQSDSNRVLSICYLPCAGRCGFKPDNSFFCPHYLRFLRNSSRHYSRWSTIRHLGQPQVWHCYDILRRSKLRWAGDRPSTRCIHR